MRVSYGSSADVAPFIDRGNPQSARDLATRISGRKHSPTEASIARASLVLEGHAKPSKDELAAKIKENGDLVEALLERTKGTKKTRAIIMIMGMVSTLEEKTALARVNHVEEMADRLGQALLPQTPEKCWGRGVAFSLAMEQAKRIVTEEGNKEIG